MKQFIASAFSFMVMYGIVITFVLIICVPLMHILMTSGL